MKKGGNPQNLTPWHKGESGNPNGRPLTPWTKALRDVGNSSEIDITLTLADGKQEKIYYKSPKGKTIRQCVAAIVYARGLIGDIRAIENAQEREEGKPEQPVKITERTFDNMTDEEIDKYLAEHGIDPKTIK